MNDQILQDILRRLARLEQTAVRYRAGEVTDVAPLDVALGGSDVSYEDVKSIQSVAVGEQVATLLWGNDLLVLGAIGADAFPGLRSMTGPYSTSVPIVVAGGAQAVSVTVDAPPAGTATRLITALPNTASANRRLVCVGYDFTNDTTASLTWSNFTGVDSVAQTIRFVVLNY